MTPRSHEGEVDTFTPRARQTPRCTVAAEGKSYGDTLCTEYSRWQQPGQNVVASSPNLLPYFGPRPCGLLDLDCDLACRSGKESVNIKLQTLMMVAV